MKFLREFLLFLTVVAAIPVVLVSTPAIGASGDQKKPLVMHIFWQEGCPYCASAKAELTSLANQNPGIEVRSIELGNNAEADALFARTLKFLGYDRAAVPLVVIGDRSFLGYSDGDRSAGLYRKAIEQCADGHCQDIVAQLSSTTATDIGPAQFQPSLPPADSSSRLLPEVIDVPVIGPLRITDLSLPALTILLAAIDGFNPCAMWVLVFLIGLLLGLNDERRMWILGGAFLFATAIMYFAVMAVWLNLVMLLGAVVWVRILIGMLAIGGGIFFLREYWTKPEAVCRVTNPNRRQKIMNAFRSVVDNNSLLLSIAGIMALAVLVNFIELLCSAGVPAVYTQVMALNDLPLATYYSYIGLYITVFMIDDIAIFATAMLALRAAGLTSSYARYSHLVGGFILLAIGAVMLLRPELLSFS